MIAEVLVAIVAVTAALLIAAVFRTREYKRKLQQCARSLKEETADRKRLLGLVESLPDFFAILGLDRKVLYSNQTKLGASAEEMVGKDFLEIVPPEARETAKKAFERAVQSGEIIFYEESVSGGAGRKRATYACRLTPLPRGKQVVGAVLTTRDITTQQQAVEILRENQHKSDKPPQTPKHADEGTSNTQWQQAKLECLGRMSEGIVHDFNNLLMGMMGHASLAQLDLPDGSPIRANLEAIETTGQRAAKILDQVLNYSGKGRHSHEPVDLNATMAEMEEPLKSSISADAKLLISLGEDLPCIEGDGDCMRQVVTALVENASESLGEAGGYIQLSTGTERCDREILKKTYLSEELTPGDYVYLEVSDTGCGIEAEAMDKIFDPFFTTKFAGRGLGLASVMGIVRAHRGAVRVGGSPTNGTTLRVLFPAAAKPAQLAPTDAGRVEETNGKRSILVVDEEPMVRALAKEMLERSGFSVLVAGDGAEAVEILESPSSEVKGVLLDVAKPEPGGIENYKRMRSIRPELQVILSSSYHKSEALSHFDTNAPPAFLQKPYTSGELVAKVREVLER